MAQRRAGWWVVVLLMAGVAEGAAQPPGGPMPVIHRVTVDRAAGTIVVTGTGLGPGFLVTVEGVPVTTLPGGSDTRLEAQAPAAVLTVGGTYRLTIVDPVRRAWDAFVIAAESPTLASPPAPPPAIIEDTNGRRTALGHQALQSNNLGEENTGVGFQALQANTSGFANTGVGYRALALATVGANTAVGDRALEATTTGSSNAALGYRTMIANTTGTNNTAVGSNALVDNVSGTQNTVVGAVAMVTNTVGNANVAVGTSALYAATGSANVAVGRFAGVSTTTGHDNIYLGANVTGASADTNTMRLGLAYDGVAGQNRTFVAGIRGTTIAGGEGVYIDANGQLGSGPVVPAVDSVGSAQVMNDALTAADLAAGSVGTSELADGAVTAAKVAFSFAGLGANAFAGTQTIGGGNLVLPKSVGGIGHLVKNGAVFLHDSGTRNTFLGGAAGSVAATGADNTATGQEALANVSTGASNAAVGAQALFKTGTGTGNTGSGAGALFNTTSGSMNTALGHRAGDANGVGSHNVFVGANVTGSASDANTMRLGLPYNVATQEGQNKTFLAGVAGTVLTGPAVQVFVDGNGQLGTLVPAPFTGTINQPVNATPRTDAALLQALEDQRALIAALTARLVALEARVAGRPARR